MIKALLARIKEGYRTGAFPPAAPSLPPEFRGRPEIDAGTSEEDVKKMKAVCPVENALNFSDGPTEDFLPLTSITTVSKTTLLSASPSISSMSV